MKRMGRRDKPRRPRATKARAGERAIKVFISHSSNDAVLAKLLIDLLHAALRLPASQILCTSVPGYKLEGGAETNEHVRKKLLAAPVFIGLITEAGLNSAYVLFELGARWGRNRQLIPLLAPGIPAGALEAPISNINALSCSIAADLHQLVQQIADKLGIKLEPAASYSNALELVTAFPPAATEDMRRPPISSVPQAAVDELAELRSEAVHEILNRPVASAADSKALADDAENWWNRVVAVLEANFSRAEQLNFTRLGVVPNVRFPHNFDERHAKILREFAVQERRLLDIIARHTR